MRVRAKRIPRDTPYLTADKWYNVTPHSSGHPRAGYIIDDTGEKTSIMLDWCAHLKGAAWEVEK